MRGVVAVIALSGTLAFAAAGCGGEPSAEEKWADDVCTAVSDWKNEVTQAKDEIKETLQSPGEGTVAAINADVRTTVDATSELADDLKALGPPDTESGTQAKQQLDALAAQLEASVNAAMQAVESLPADAGLAESAQALAPLVLALQSLASNTTSTLSAIQASGTDLKEGFDKADSCREFRR